MCGRGFICRWQRLCLLGGEAEKSAREFLRGSEHGSKGTQEGDAMGDP